MTSPQGELAGRSILVTGGGTGIGAGIAARLAREGAWVSICGRTKATLSETAERINTERGREAVRWWTADVTNEAEVKQVVADAAAWRDRLDGVVSNAGGGGELTPLHLQEVAEFERVMRMNVTGTLLLAKHTIPLFARRGGGCFVAISSVAAQVTHPYFGAYTASKAAVEALVRNAADEYGAVGIRFNSVRPGLTMTDSMAFLTPESPIYQSYADNSPLGGASDVDDVAQTVSFLLSDRADRVTGQSISVDGGHGLRRGPDWSASVERRVGPREVLLALRDRPSEPA